MYPGRNRLNGWIELIGEIEVIVIEREWYFCGNCCAECIESKRR